MFGFELDLGILYPALGLCVIAGLVFGTLRWKAELIKEMDPLHLEPWVGVVELVFTLHRLTWQVSVIALGAMLAQPIIAKFFGDRLPSFW